MMIEMLFAEAPIEGVGVSTPVRPGRSRTRSKEKVDEKSRNVPAEKKSPPRKAPTRGRYVDEYAGPPGM